LTINSGQGAGTQVMSSRRFGDLVDIAKENFQLRGLIAEHSFKNNL
jgi:hypothetical protein